jgi:hypothetical protein
VKVAERDGALERGEEHRLAAEAALQEAWQQIRHAAEGLGALDFRGLPDDDQLEPEQQGERPQQQVARLRRGPPEERDQRFSPP